MSLQTEFKHLQVNKPTIISGWLYCLYNECFKSYGSNVYKLGRTMNLKQRLSQYTTSYIQPSHFICVSFRKFRDSRKAEAVLFYILRMYRIVENREFFNIPSVQVRFILDRLSNLSDDLIEELYSQILQKVVPKDIYDQIIDTEEEFEWVHKSLEYKSWLDEFFQKFRFRPKDPSFYHRTGLRPEEEEELYHLIVRAKEFKQSQYQNSMDAVV
jgi:T5orf172 domain